MGHCRSTVAVFTFTFSRMPEGRKVSGDTALIYSLTSLSLFETEVAMYRYLCKKRKENEVEVLIQLPAQALKCT